MQDKSSNRIPGGGLIINNFFKKRKLVKPNRYLKQQFGLTYLKKKDSSTMDGITVPCEIWIENIFYSIENLKQYEV